MKAGDRKLTIEPRQPAKSIPHPPRRVPILGDVLGMDPKRPNQRTLHQMSRLGPIYRRSFIGGAKLTFIGSSALLAEVSNEKQWERFAGRPIVRLRGLAGRGLFTAENDSAEWNVGHDTLMPGFTKDAMRRYHDTMLAVLRDSTDALAARSGQVDDVAAFTANIALEVIGRCGFGYTFGALSDQKRHPFAGALTRALAYTQESAIPVVGALRSRSRAKEAAADRALLRATVQEVVTARRASGERHPDLLDLMLHDATGELDDEMIADQILTFLVAGHETTGNVLAFAAHYIAHEPGIAQTIRDEVNRVCAGREVAFEDVARLRYTRAVVSETLRLWPTAPGFFRQARVDTSLGGYEVSAGEWVFVLLLGVHRDRAAWGADADEFRPDRFLDGAIPGEQYKPFGTGPRACIGRAFALHEAVLVLASLVSNYELTPRSDELDVEENLTLRPTGVRIDFTRREGAASVGR